MKFFLTTIVLLVTFNAFATQEPRTSCPKTRVCKVDRDCRIYAFKHNCHAQCQAAVIELAGQTSEPCPLQCLCLKKVKLENA